MVGPGQNSGTGACQIDVNGRSIGALHGQVQDVTVQLKRGISATATIRIGTFRDERGRWSAQDSGQFNPWDTIVISAVFGGIREEEVMRGVVRELRADYPDDMGAAQLLVEAQDDLIKLDRDQQHGVLSSEGEEIWDGQLVRDLAETVGLRDVTAENGLRTAALNIASTPVKLIRDRAEANGFEFYTREGRLYFGPPRLDAPQQDRILVYAGPATNCTSFTIQHDGHKPDQVRMTRLSEQEGDRDAGPEIIDPDQHSLGRRPLTSAGRGLPPFVWSLDRPIGASDSEARKRAQAKANENAFKIVANGRLDGTVYGHVLWPYAPVDIDGVGETYGGTYYVDAVTHRFTASAYEQEFTVIRNAIN